MSRKAKETTAKRGESGKRSACPTRVPSPFRWGWTLVVVLATILPYLLNWRATPPGYHYSWILPPYPEDSLGYGAWAEQAAHGAWLFKIKYTALPHQPFLFHPIFLICGWLSALFSCNMGILFLIVKTIGVLIFFALFYRYIDYLGLGPVSSIAATILVGVSAGFGGLLAMLQWWGNQGLRVSADLWMPEMFTYWALLWNPLFPLSLSLMLLTIYWLDRGTRHNESNRIWGSGLTTGLMALVHPYSTPLLFALAVAFIVGRRRTRAGRDLGRYFAAALPCVLYVALVARLNPLLAEHSALGEMKSPSVVSYLLGFGLPLLIAVAGLIVGWKKLAGEYWQLILWFGVALVLAYFPFWFQRKLVFGAHIPLCILAGLAFESFWTRCSANKNLRWVPVTAALVLLPLLVATPVYLFARERAEVAQNKNAVYYLSDDLLNAMAFLKEKSAPDQIVFSSLATSRLIPALSGNTVVWGHWAMSIDLKDRQAWAANIFDPKSPLDDETKARSFWGTDIQFVVVDAGIRQWLQDQPSVAERIFKDAAKVFENSSFAIYRRPEGFLKS